MVDETAGALRRRTSSIVLVALIVVVALVAVRNALVYPPGAGYDAEHAIEYAERLVKDGRFPDATGSYYTPPGFFALGGLGIVVGEALGLGEPLRLGQLVNALAAVGTAILLLLLVRELWPGRRLLHVAALGFFVACPVVFKSAAMFHPEPLSLLVSTAALVIAARILVRREYSVWWAIALGVALGAGQLVRAWTLWTVGVVLLVLVIAVVTQRADRRALTRVLVLAAAVAILVPLPWYAHQATRYSSPIFDRPQPEAPLWDRRPLAFFVGTGLPDVITRPYRPSFSDRFAPIAYTEIWGDYFGIWRWNPARGEPDDAARRDLVLQSLVAIPLTLLAVAGWLLLLARSVRHPGRDLARHLVSLLPAAALLGVLYFATAYPTADGDTAKGSFMLTAVPAWAACFGFACDGLARRFPRLVVPGAVLLALAAVVGLRFALSIDLA